MSQATVGTTNGPTLYNARIGVNGAPFTSISGGWKTLAADGVWHRGIVATNSVRRGTKSASCNCRADTFTDMFILVHTDAGWRIADHTITMRPLPGS